jgi:hypothetical protein
MRTRMAGSGRRAAAATAVTLILAGCAGDGAGLDASGQPLTRGSGDAGPLTADFDSIQAQVFTPICTLCHIGAAAPHGLRLDAADSYGLLVGVPSDEVPSILRVKPGDPDNSYLIQKLEGHAAVGARMPFGGPYLANDTVAVIRQWITDGASRSSAASAATTFGIVSVVPAVHDMLDASPPQIMIAVNHDLDATSVSPESVRIERVTTDGVAVSAQNPRALMLWPVQPLREGHYRVTVSAAAATAPRDIAGSPIVGGPADAMVTAFDIGAAP